jgi:thiol reductant ABC exporter CydC subunit
MMWLLRQVGLRALLLAVIAAVLADLAGISLIGAATWLLVRAAQRPQLAALAVGIAGVRAAAMVRGVARYGERLAGHDAALGALAGLRDRVYRALASQSAARRRAENAGPLPTKQGSASALGVVVHDVDAVQDLVVRCVIPFAGAVLVSAVAVTVVWLLSPIAGPVLAAGLGVAIAVVPVLAGWQSHRSDQLVAADRAELTVGVVDLFRGAAELAVTGTGAATRADVDRAALGLTTRQSSAPAHGATAAVLLIAGGTAAASIAFSLAADPTTGRITAAVVTLVVLATFEVCAPLPAAARQLARIAGSIRRLRDLADTPSVPDRQDIATGPLELVLDHLTVSYRADDTPALRDIDLRLPPGRRIAVIGTSGSGKSTLLATIARFVAPATGRIAIGGADLADWQETQLRGTVGGVLTDAHVFHDSIAVNLRIGKPEATDAELAAVAARMRLLAWIESLPDGWQTVLGEDAAFASGGQRQRLLLARALLADPPVLLLDEPTEGLDSETADAVLADVLSATEGQSVVLVTHRLTGLARFDEVVVLDGGRIRQRGPHHELAGVPGPYRDMWRIREVIG